MLTDSGGAASFSGKTRKSEEEGVKFKSIIDGSSLFHHQKKQLKFKIN